jgi:predicted hydrocarbon binding protein
MGREWGRRAADQFAEEIGAFRGRTLSELPLAMYCADLTQAFRRHGWGVFDFDLSRYCDGILVVHVQDPIIGGAIRSADRPVDRVLQAFLAGMFSRFANEELDCLQTEFRGDGDSRCRFVITKAERIREVADGVGVRTHGELIEQLARR